jgi:hypothetical protein
MTRYHHPDFLQDYAVMSANQHVPLLQLQYRSGTIISGGTGWRM